MIMTPFGLLRENQFGYTRQQVVIADPPVIDSSAMADSAYFQDGGLLTFSGAKVTGATSMQWQRLNGSEWEDVSGQTAANFSKATALSGDGSYRLKAVNGNSDPAYSKTVSAVCAYLKMQNDIDNADPTVVANSKTDYTWTTQGGQKYISAMLFIWRTNEYISRQVVTWQTSNASVAPVSGLQASGQLRPILKSGRATYTATIGNLKSTMNVIVS